MFRSSLNKFLFQFFPPPNFLMTPSFGFDLSDKSLKFVELIETKKGIKIGKYGEREISAGIIESGKIKNREKLKEILASLRKEEGIKFVRVSLPEEQVYLFTLRLEKAGLKKIREAIELVLEEHVPISAKEAIFDFDLIKEDPEGLDIQVAVVPKSIIEDYMSIFKDVSISVQSFEAETQAISRAVIKKGDPETYLVVDFGHDRTGIFIVSQGIVVLSSTFDIGGAALNKMIQKNFNISPEEAEKMKRQYGLERNAQNKEIFAVLLNSASVLRDEVARYLLYWNTHKNEEGKRYPLIKKIILCGGDSNLTGFSEYLSVSTRNKVEMANVWINITKTEENIPEISFSQSLRFAPAIGLALGNFNYD